MKSNSNFKQKFIDTLIGRKDTLQDEKINIHTPSMKEKLNNLVKISDEAWGLYAFRREPLEGKFTNDKKIELIKKANKCGQEYANKIKQKYGEISIYDLAIKLGLEVESPDKPVGGGHIIFAQFVEPNKVTIFKDSIDKAESLVLKENLMPIFSNAKVYDILLAHEIFHFIEENNKDEIFTHTEKIRLWKFGPIKNDSNIVCLSEIAGMAFAKELLNIPYSPYILDVFLVSLYNEEVSYGLYNEIMNISQNI